MLFRKELMDALQSSEPIQQGRAYAIVTALRGPDNYVGKTATQLKQLTNARLRGFVFADHGLAKVCVMETAALSKARCEERDSLFMTTNESHFVSHWIEAVHAVKALFNYDLENEKEVPKSV